MSTISNLILAAGSSVYQADALESYGHSPETATMRAKTMPIMPVGKDGVAIFRRLFINVRHRAGVSFHVTPYIDSVEATELRTFCNRPAPGGADEERHDFMIPLHRTTDGVRTGLRGTALELYFERVDALATAHLESVVVAFQPVIVPRGREATE